MSKKNYYEITMKYESTMSMGLRLAVLLATGAPLSKAVFIKTFTQLYLAKASTINCFFENPNVPKLNEVELEE